MVPGRLYDGGMVTFQCPECKLRFRFETELQAHLKDEHPEFHADPKSLEDSLLPHHHKGRKRHYDTSS